MLRAGKDEFGKPESDRNARDHTESEVVLALPAGEYELEVCNGEMKGASRTTPPAGEAVEATPQLR